MGLEIGASAPDVDLASQAGERVRLSEVWRDKIVVLFFYPKDGTPGCTAEACAFRDAYDEFSAAGAEVIGVSADDVDSHERFAGRHQLNFRILADPDRAARKAYEVKDTVAMIMPGRETFVIDRGGVIRHRFSSQLRAHKHVDEALAVVRRLASTKNPDAGSTAADLANLKRR